MSDAADDASPVTSEDEGGVRLQPDLDAVERRPKQHEDPVEVTAPDVPVTAPGGKVLTRDPVDRDPDGWRDWFAQEPRRVVTGGGTTASEFGGYDLTVAAAPLHEDGDADGDGSAGPSAAMPVPPARSDPLRPHSARHRWPLLPTRRAGPRHTWDRDRTGPAPKPGDHVGPVVPHPWMLAALLLAAGAAGFLEQEQSGRSIGSEQLLIVVSVETNGSDAWTLTLPLPLYPLNGQEVKRLTPLAAQIENGSENLTVVATDAGKVSLQMTGTGRLQTRGLSVWAHMGLNVSHESDRSVAANCRRLGVRTTTPASSHSMVRRAPRRMCGGRQSLTRAAAADSNVMSSVPLTIRSRCSRARSI